MLFLRLFPIYIAITNAIRLKAGCSVSFKDFCAIISNIEGTFCDVFVKLAAFSAIIKFNYELVYMKINKPLKKLLCDVIHLKKASITFVITINM